MSKRTPVIPGTDYYAPEPSSAPPQQSYCINPYHYNRRKARAVKVGNVTIGGGEPVVVQSMITSDTMDTAASAQQTLDLAGVGCQIVRITAPTVKDAANLEKIRDEVRKAGSDVPLVADIHFKPEAAMEAAKWVEKVRVNPGNYADKKKFAIIEYTDEQYAAELARIEEAFTPLVKLCQERGIAMRIGTNHGSLSDRIMNRYGDSPQGMVESALEFTAIARKHGYHDIVYSMKASNPKVMINAYRYLNYRLQELGSDWNYPIHLGVTEAGNAEDGRIKSAIGIGALLSDGVGETIRVSLTEDSVHEIPVAKALVKLIERHNSEPLPPSQPPISYNPFSYTKRASKHMTVQGVVLGDNESTKVATTKNNYLALEPKKAALGDIFPDFVYEEAGVLEVDPNDEATLAKLADPKGAPQFVTIKDGIKLSPIVAFRFLAAKIAPQHPILLKDMFHAPEAGAKPDVLETMLHAATQLGTLLCDGIGDAVLVRGEPGPGASVRLAFNILQASGNRIFKTDYVACPSCGRTLFNLQDTTAKIKAATGHLKGVRIAIMGCIVNGPGEMADADFGYVGGAPGKVNLYIGKSPVKFNIPEVEAVDRLIDLIKEHNRWVEPQAKSADAELVH